MLHNRLIALVEDDDIMGRSLLQRLELEGARVRWFKTLHRALGELRTPKRRFDAVLCDICLPDGSGETLFQQLSVDSHPPPVVFMTGRGDASQAVRLMHAGAADYVVKPFDLAKVLALLERLVEQSVQGPGEPLLGTSDAARQIETDLKRLAAIDSPVVIVGEPGTGKRRVAERLHALSGRCRCKFTVFDLAGKEPADQEATLFGDGGLVGQGGNGVLVLEHASQAASRVQAQLVDLVCSENSGAPRLVLIDTDGGLLQERLRPDLYFRASPQAVHVPPLRERPEDAVWMMHRMFDGMNARRDVPLKGISSMAEEAVMAYAWPGNGREVRSRLARAMALARGDVVFPADLFGGQDGGERDDFPSLNEARDRAERLHIQRALARTGGNMGEAARILHVSRTTLWEKLQKLGLGEN